MIKEEAIEILSDMRAEYNIFSDDEEEATWYHALSWAIQALNERKKAKWVHGKEIAREYLAGRITYIEYKDYHCSECGYTVEDIRWNVDGELVDKYCTACGAQMEVENDE